MLLGTETVHVLTYPMIKERGKQIPDTSAEPARDAVPWCDVQPGVSVELQAERRDSTSISWTVFAPAGAPIGTDSIVEVRGDPYQVDGEPQDWTTYLLVLLTRWEA